MLTAANVMETPRPVVTETSGPRTALKQMRDAYMSAAYVVGRDRHLVGIVTDRDAVKLVRKGETSLASVLKPVPQSIDENEILMNLFIPSVESPLPLAVTDTEGRLTGVIPRVTLLAALGPGSGATGELTIPLQPMSATMIDEVLEEATAAAAGTPGSTGNKNERAEEVR